MTRVERNDGQNAESTIVLALIEPNTGDCAYRACDRILDGAPLGLLRTRFCISILPNAEELGVRTVLDNVYSDTTTRY